VLIEGLAINIALGAVTVDEINHALVIVSASIVALVDFAGPHDLRVVVSAIILKITIISIALFVLVILIIVGWDSELLSNFVTDALVQSAVNNNGNMALSLFTSASVNHLVVDARLDSFNKLGDHLETIALTHLVVFISSAVIITATWNEFLLEGFTVHLLNILTFKLEVNNALSFKSAWVDAGTDLAEWQLQFISAVVVHLARHSTSLIVVTV